MSWRKCLVLAPALMLLGLCAPASTAAPTTAAAIEATQWRSGLIELNQGWLEHDGDKTEWSRPEFTHFGLQPLAD